MTASDKADRDPARGLYLPDVFDLRGTRLFRASCRNAFKDQKVVDVLVAEISQRILSLKRESQPRSATRRDQRSHPHVSSCQSRPRPRTTNSGDLPVRRYSSISCRRLPRAADISQRVLPPWLMQR